MPIITLKQKKKGKTKKTYNQSFKVLIVTKVEIWKCPSGCELKGINNKLKVVEVEANSLEEAKSKAWKTLN